ncbi:MAG: aldo/keto reductase, partial [Blautia coccoides]
MLKKFRRGTCSQSGGIPSAVQPAGASVLLQGEQYCGKYAPLARGAYLHSQLLLEIGRKYQKTTAQIGLRWAVQQGISVIPKSVHKERIRENAEIFDFSLTRDEMDAITAMDAHQLPAGIPEDM